MLNFKDISSEHLRTGVFCTENVLLADGVEVFGMVVSQSNHSGGRAYWHWRVSEVIAPDGEVIMLAGESSSLTAGKVMVSTLIENLADAAYLGVDTTAPSVEPRKSGSHAVQTYPVPDRLRNENLAWWEGFAEPNGHVVIPACNGCDAIFVPDFDGNIIRYVAAGTNGDDCKSCEDIL